MAASDIQISLVWPDLEEQPVHRANQFLGQIGPGPDGAPEEFILTVGYVTPPVLLGSAEEQVAMLGALGAISVKALARFSMSRGRLDELLQILKRAADQYDTAIPESPQVIREIDEGEGPS